MEERLRSGLEVREPRTKEEFDSYYRLRWEVLRKPWNRPEGSEKDELEKESIHVMACVGARVVGVGRAHFNSQEEAQARYMAVDEAYRGKGVGASILAELEKQARSRGAKHIVLNSRATAAEFYKKCGYAIVEQEPTLFGTIPHWKMKKTL